MEYDYCIMSSLGKKESPEKDGNESRNFYNKPHGKKRGGELPGAWISLNATPLETRVCLQGGLACKVRHDAFLERRVVGLMILHSCPSFLCFMFGNSL